MSGSSKIESSLPDSSACSRWVYVAVALAAFSIRFWFSSSRDIGFDEAWDIFVARQSLWGDLFKAVAATSHPPAFYFLLHFVGLLGSAQIFDPLVSVICGVVSVLLVGKILRELGVSKSAEYAGMLLCAFSQVHIAISVIVRPYALANCCMSLSFFFFLRLLRSRFLSRSASFFFFGFLCAALFSHYSAGLYACALFLMLIILAVLDRSVRGDLRQACLPFSAGVVRFFAAPLFALLFLVYLALSAQGSLFASKSLLATRDPLQLTPYRYLRSFVYSGAEPISTYVTRNSAAEYSLFFPSAGSDAISILVLFALLGLMVAAGVRTAVQSSSRTGACRAAVYLLLPCSFLVLLALGLLAKYPFGGELRQQFFVFSFGLVAIVALLDSLPLRAPTKNLIFVALVGASIARLMTTPLDDSEFGKLVPFSKTSSVLREGKPIFIGTWTAFTLYGQNRDAHLQLRSRGEIATEYEVLTEEGRSRLFVAPQVYFESYSENELAQRVKNLMLGENLSELYVVGFPLGRIRCKVCDKKVVQRSLAEQLGDEEFEVVIERERTKNGEGYAIVRRKSAER
ncbi:MAG: glycosyltransferase family 39 protein [Deltaproteobacteria bacterium]|nr:glycosyltransferase family 39 protein [Deltaproteobacteria bacterium]